jgi:Na+/H+ antiporter NhaA
VLEALTFLAGVAIGVVIGRWWALLAPAAFGLWLGFASEVEVPGWVLGVGYGLIGGIGVTVGVLLRRLAVRKRA